MQSSTNSHQGESSRWRPSIMEHDEASSDNFSDYESVGTERSTTSSKKSKKNKKNKHKSNRHPNERCTRACRVKSTIIIIVMMFAILFSTGFLMFTKREEEDDFAYAFNLAAENVLDTVDLNARYIEEAFAAFGLGVAGFAAAVSSSSSNSNVSSWPWVTIPNWVAQSTLLAHESGSHQVGFMPLVLESERTAWEAYSVQNFDSTFSTLDELPAEYIWRYTSLTDQTPYPEDKPPLPYYAPIWQTTTLEESPIMPVGTMNNRNAYNMDFFQMAMKTVLREQVPVQTRVLYELETESLTTTPVTAFLAPIMDAASNDGDGTEKKIVGVTVGWLEWDFMFSHLLPEGMDAVVVVVGTEKNCQEPFTLQINGPNVTYLGTGDHHDADFNGMAIKSTFEAWTPTDDCGFYEFTLYPSSDFQESYETILPWVYSGIVLLVFTVAVIMFILYDWAFVKYTSDIQARAARTDAIVNSLFPANVRDRLMEGDDDDQPGTKKKSYPQAAANDSFSRTDKGEAPSGKTSGPHFGEMETDSSGVFTTKPIADLFPSCTVLFADIVGFTAWASTREPSQVFTLLETTYNAFDKIAQRRKVFKVETIGDCYVAASGLPDPRKDHAIVMSRFAYDCLVRMKEVVQRLEMSLGPDTAELGMRFGLHSGPVTAGVLRGEKSRFQLFGDTVNTAARIESTGERDKIHLSDVTAEQLTMFGKSHWIQKRETLVTAKGKGEIQTYWLTVGQPKRRNSRLRADGTPQPSSASNASMEMMQRPIEQIAKRIVDNRMQRLIGWNVDVLKRQLRQILAMRDPSSITPSMAKIVGDDHNEEPDGGTKDTDNSSHDGSSSGKSLEGFQIRIEDPVEEKPVGMVLDEVADIIQLPSEPTETKIDPYQIEFSPEVINQLTDYVTSIAQMYRENPFHSFEHASHVTMSVCKLLSRVVTPNQSIDYQSMQVQDAAGVDLHKYTYEITSDPICQFACALAALIHDVDHTGVPNAVLVEEQAEIAKHYKNKSCAEQNSFDLAWGLLMEPQYQELRNCIYSTPEELTRFRQLLINSVMATDIADKELGAQRKARWAKAFDASATPVNELSTSELQEDSNRKATIVIEHLIQASDVSHTMQHWHVYIKWNEKLFQEMYKAYLEGRTKVDPSENWYTSEIGFFDFYLIPLAKKLKECGVFGVASDEYLSYVTANRQEWQSRGQNIVKDYLKNYEEQYSAVIHQGGAAGGTILEESHRDLLEESRRTTSS